MTDETPAEGIKTATDVKIEALEKQLADLKANYENQLKEAQQANQDLWAMLHPAQPQAEPQTMQQQPQEDVTAKVLKAKLGIDITGSDNQ